MKTDDKHKDAIERYEAYALADRDNRLDAQDDLRHLGGDMWDDSVRQLREREGRPVITINKLPQFVNQVAGEIRQAQPAIEPVPVDSETDPILTDIMGSIIRNIESESNASTVYSWGAQCAIAGGIGHWQVVTEYADDTTFDQDIRIKRILDPLSVVWDSASTELDRSDAWECFVTEVIPKEQFKRRFKGEKTPEDFPVDSGLTANSLLNWSTGSDDVRVASHWWREETKKKIGLIQGGKIVDLTDIAPAMWNMMGVVKAREVPAYDIMHCLLSGDGYLEQPKKWAGKCIPVVPVIGNEMAIDGKIMRHGIIRFAKDPARLYNYFRSAQAELIGTQPKAPYIGTAAMFEGLEDIWAKANTANLPYLPYNPDPNAPTAKPQREAPPQGSAAMYQEVQIAENDLYGTTGIYPTSLGQKSNESSGRAIMARERQSDTGTFVYTDNFKNASMVKTGKILLDLIPRIYDTERHIRILGQDGMEKMASINMIRRDPFMGDVIVNDLSAAKFDVRIKVGAAFASAREKMAEMLNGLITANPAMMQVVGDLYFENLDVPGANKLAARIKKTMPAALVGEGGMEQPPNQQAEQAAALQLEKMAADISKTQVETKGKQIDNASKAFQFGASAAPMAPEATAQ